MEVDSHWQVWAFGANCCRGFLGWFPQRLWVIVLLPNSLLHPFPFVYSVAAVEVKASLSPSKANESHRLKMRTALPVSLASTKEAGSQTSSENELISDCWKLNPCASVAAGVNEALLLRWVLEDLSALGRTARVGRKKHWCEQARSRKLPWRTCGWIKPPGYQSWAGKRPAERQFM